jgi:hypothetical protein
MLVAGAVAVALAGDHRLPQVMTCLLDVPLAQVRLAAV